MSQNLRNANEFNFEIYTEDALHRVDVICTKKEGG